MNDLPFIDAHMHLWDLGHIHYAWLTPPFADGGPNGNVAPIARTYRVSDYRAEAKNWNVVGAVHVEAGAAYERALDESDWLMEAAAREGLPTGIVASAQLNDLNVEALLAAQAQRGRVKGVRHIVNWHRDPNRTYTPRDFTRDEAWVRGFGVLSKYDLSFDLQAYPGQFCHLAQIIAAHQETSVIVNHAGQGVDRGEDGVSEWRRGMKALAALANVSVKISGLGFVYRPWDAAAARDRARETIDIFGPSRCMVASDFPTDRLFAPFDEVMSAFVEACADLNDGERRALFARNANRIYRLGLTV